MPLSEEEKTRSINLDEIEPETVGAAETGDPIEPDCKESPSGEHEFDFDEEKNTDACVYCGQEKGE